MLCSVARVLLLLYCNYLSSDKLITFKVQIQTPLKLERPQFLKESVYTSMHLPKPNILIHSG